MWSLKLCTERATSKRTAHFCPWPDLNTLQMTVCDALVVKHGCTVEPWTYQWFIDVQTKWQSNMRLMNAGHFHKVPSHLWFASGVNICTFLTVDWPHFSWNGWEMMHPPEGTGFCRTFSPHAPFKPWTQFNCFFVLASSQEIYAYNFWLTGKNCCVMLHLVRLGVLVCT